jgi:hypothetical protein
MNNFEPDVNPSISIRINANKVKVIDVLSLVEYAILIKTIYQNTYLSKSD